MPGCGWSEDVACDAVGNALAVGLDGWCAPPCCSSITVGRPGARVARAGMRVGALTGTVELEAVWSVCAWWRGLLP